MIFLSIFIDYLSYYVMSWENCPHLLHRYNHNSKENFSMAKQTAKFKDINFLKFKKIISNSGAWDCNASCWGNSFPKRYPDSLWMVMHISRNKRNGIMIYACTFNEFFVYLFKNYQNIHIIKNGISCLTIVVL